MPSKSALKRQLSKQTRKGESINSALNVKRNARDALRQTIRDAANANSRFGLSHSLDNPKDTPAKWQRVSHIKHNVQRWGLTK